MRDVAHITPENFPHCVTTIRTFVEASYKSNLSRNYKANSGRTSPRSTEKRTPKGRQISVKRIRSAPQNIDYDADESSDEEGGAEYTQVNMQLLDLMHTLHTRAKAVHQASSIA